MVRFSSSILCLCFAAAAVVVFPGRSVSAAQASSSYAPETRGFFRGGVAYDTNPYRLFKSDDRRSRLLAPDGDWLFRYYGQLQGRHRETRNSSTSVRLSQGGKVFSIADEVNTLLTRGVVRHMYRLSKQLSWTTSIGMKDRSERISRLDYNYGYLDTKIDWRLGNWGLTGGLGWQYFVFKPVMRLSSQGPRGEATLRYRFSQKLQGTARYSATSRLYGRGAGVGNPNSRRRDLLHLGRLGVSWDGSVILKAAYSYSSNQSTIPSGEFNRHALELTATFPIAWKWIGTLHTELQSTGVDPINPSQTTDETNRNAAAVSLSRPLSSNLNVEFRYSAYTNVLEPDPGYRRQVMLLSVERTFD